VTRLYFQIVALPLLAVAITTRAQDDGLDIRYAEHQPLATQSLLLDITQGPGDVLVAVGERGHVVLSVDQENWRQAETVPTRSTLTSVTAQGDRLWAAGHDSVIITSGDGGQTWTRQYFDPDRQQPILDLLFLDDQHGLAVGAYGLYLVTFDGGETWEDSAVSDEEWHLNSITQLGDGRLFIAGEAGFSYLSEDEGESWTLLEMPYEGSMWNAVALPDGCLLTFGLRGHALQSCDGGETWSEPDTGTEASLSGGALDGDRLVLVGNGGTLTTRVGDGAFEALQHPSGVDFAVVLSRGDGSFLVIGEDGVHHWTVGDGEASGP
jgi:photosystem II stability/assembly factor-like uncharacterized protein